MNAPWTHVIGFGLACMIAGVGVLSLGLAAISSVSDGGPSPDVGYVDPTIRDNVIWAFIGLVFLAAAGYLAIHTIATG